MFVVIFLLALDVAVHDNSAVVAFDLTWLEAHGTHGKVRLNVLSNCQFIGHHALIVNGIRVSSQVHQELSYFSCATFCSEMKWCVSITVSDIWLSVVLEEQIQYLIAAVVSGCLK